MFRSTRKIGLRNPLKELFEREFGGGKDGPRNCFEVERYVRHQDKN